MSLPCVAVIGGSGALGKGLSMRWLAAGYNVIIGTRNPDKADAVLQEVVEQLTKHNIELSAQQLQVKPNAQAASEADIVVLTVPYAHQQPTLEEIQSGLENKILIDTTVPLRPPKVAKVQLPEAGSAAQEAQAFLNTLFQDSLEQKPRVVSAFQNVAAAHLQAMGNIDCDVLVCGEKEARESVMTHIEAVGVKAFSAGPLANAAAQEALTSILITINRQYKCHAGIRISGVGD